MEDINAELEKYSKDIKKDILKLINDNKFIQAHKIIDEYNNIIDNDVEIYAIGALLAIKEEKLDEAEEVSLKGLVIDESNFDLLYNLGFIYELKKDAEKCIKFYRLSLINTVDIDLKNEIENKIKKLENDRECSFIIDDTCDIRGNDRICFGRNVVIQKDCWLNIAYNNPNNRYMIEIGENSNIGRRCTISSANKIVLGKNVLLGPNVLISDHNHEYKHIGIPIIDQGITSYENCVKIGDNSWIGTNSVIVGNITIGKNCVIAANSVVNRDVPDYCVAAGNPAKVVKIFDIETGRWININNKDELKELIRKRQDLLDYCVPITGLKSLQVEVSSSCNLKCPQCFNQIKGHKSGFLSKKIWNEKISPYLKQLENIHLVGIGEPFLCKDFFYFVEDAKKNNVNVHTTSNLQLVNSEIAELIVTSGIKELSFSCDGSTKETYEGIRINGTFEKLLESLDLINKFKLKYNSKFPNLILNFGAIKKNIHELPQVVELAHKYKVSNIIAYHDIIYVEKLKEQSLYNFQKKSDEMFLEAKTLADKLSISIVIPGLFSNPLKYEDKGVYCGYPFYHLWIYSDGRIGPCCMDFPDRYILGDLNTSTIEEVWNSKPILKLRKELIAEPSEICRYCVNHGKMDISDSKTFFRY